MLDSSAIASALAGVLVTVTFLYVRSQLAARHEESGKAERRAWWEGKVTEQLSTLQREVDRQSSSLLRIEDKLRSIAPRSEARDGT